MSAAVLDPIGLAVAAALLVYLVIALVLPERF